MSISGYARQNLARVLGSQTSAQSIVDAVDALEAGGASEVLGTKADASAANGELYNSSDSSGVAAKNSAGVKLFSFGATSITVGQSANLGGSGLDPTAFGFQAAYQATGDYCSYYGRAAGLQNTGDLGTFMGHSSGYQQSGDRPTHIGYGAGRLNTGSRHAALGEDSGQDNTGDGAVHLGENTGNSNKGNHHIAMGEETGAANTAFYSIHIGRNTGQFNEGNYNVIVGGLAAMNFTEDAGNAVTFDSSDVTLATKRFVITAHGFTGNNGGDAGRPSFVNLKYAEGTAAIPDLEDGSIYLFQIIDENTLEFNQADDWPTPLQGRLDTAGAVGAGTGHTLTPQVVYDNASGLGHGVEPDASNQVMLGDSSVTQVKTAGGYTPGTLADSAAPNNSIYYSSTQSALCYKNAAGAVSTINLTAT